MSSFFHSITIEGKKISKNGRVSVIILLSVVFIQEILILTLGNVFFGGPSFSVYLLQVLNYTEFSLNYDEMKHYMLITYDVAIVNMGSNTGFIDCKQCKFK